MIGGDVSKADLAVGGHTPAMEPSPFAIPAKKLEMWLFIMCDIMRFEGCLVGYGFLRNATPDWPRPFQSSTIASVMVMSFIMITSSLTMALAVRAARAGDRATGFRWTMITLAGGVLFPLPHMRELVGRIGQGRTFLKNPLGTHPVAAGYL